MEDGRWEANAPESRLRARLRRCSRDQKGIAGLSIVNCAPDPRRSAAAVQHGMDADSIRFDSVIDSEWKAPTQAPMITQRSWHAPRHERIRHRCPRIMNL